VVDVAVGIIIGAAFGAIVKSVVADVVIPPIGLLLGNLDFSNLFMLLKQGAVAGLGPFLLSQRLKRLTAPGSQDNILHRRCPLPRRS